MYRFYNSWGDIIISNSDACLIQGGAYRATATGKHVCKWASAGDQLATRPLYRYHTALYPVLTLGSIAKRHLGRAMEGESCPSTGITPTNKQKTTRIMLVDHRAGKKKIRRKLATADPYLYI